MKRIFQKALLGGLLFSFFCPLVSADVKLRLYLRDGSLQAGNLVSETEKVFVLLTKNGREEVPKDKIMFINGKPLVYWQQHPERNYQTEIIPSEIPNPAFVNDKAALPPVPLPAATPLPKLESVLASAVATPVVKPTVVPNSTSPSTPVMMAAGGFRTVSQEKKISTEPTAKPTPASSITKPVPTPTPASASSVAPMVRRHARGSARKRSRPTTTSTDPVAPALGIIHPSAFSREGMAVFFADRAGRYLEEGKRGRAIQDLHMAVLLNRRDMDSHLKLGRLYAEDGLRKWTEKYLATPGLRKNEGAALVMKNLDDLEKDQERVRLILYGGTAAGFLSIFPMLFAVRRITRTRKTVTRVFSADALNDLVPPPTSETLSPSEESDRSLDREPESRPEEAKLPVPVPSVFAQIPPVVAKSALIAPPPVETKPEIPPAKAPEPLVPPPVMKIEPLPLEKSSEMKPPEPRLEPVAPAPAFSPETSPRSMDDLLRSREDFLRASKSVDELVAKGHAHASEGMADAARKAYRTALALHPQCLDATLGLAYLCFVQENWELALEHYLHAAQINPKSADVHYGIGRVFLETGHEAEAVEEFRQTLALDPTFYEARETLTALNVPV